MRENTTRMATVIVTALGLLTVGQAYGAQAETNMAAEAERIVPQCKTGMEKPPVKVPSRGVVDGPRRGNITTVVEHGDSLDATEEFSFTNVPAPLRNDAAAKATFTIVDGDRDDNSGAISVLNDGKVPDEEDQPSMNFFFKAGSDGGRVAVDLGAAIDVTQVTTYSWHPNSRGPQVYRLYASEGTVSGFNARPKEGTDPATCGWKLIADVDARPTQGEPGGQYGVSILAPGGTIGICRYLLFCFSCTDTNDPFSNTFYSEIDVVDANAPAPEAVKPLKGKHIREVVATVGGTQTIIIDTTEMPDLTDWAHHKLAPVVAEWYPKIVALLPGKGYAAPGRIKITFSKGKEGDAVAATAGARIYCQSDWFRGNLEGEARGAVVHEMVHVVQQYDLGSKRNRNAAPTPGWLEEGIADYIRWYLYEPQSHGCEIEASDLPHVRYDDQYRVSANFLDWVIGRYDKDLIAKLNAALRDGIYSEKLWKQYTGHDIEALNSEWKQSLEKKPAEGRTEPVK